MNKYNLKRLRQTKTEKICDIYRFTFMYNKTKYTIKCVGGLTVCFNDAEDVLPEDVKCDITEAVYADIDKHEHRK